MKTNTLKRLIASMTGAIMLAGAFPGGAMAESWATAPTAEEPKTTESGAWLLSSVSVSPAKASVAVGDSAVLKAMDGKTSVDNKNVLWLTSDKSIVNVTGDGIITGVSPGTATVTAMVGPDVTADCAVTVYWGEPENTYDLSEWNMVTNTRPWAEDGTDTTGYGGSQVMARAYLARWDGPVSEEQDPYPAYDEAFDSEASYRELGEVLHVQEVITVPSRKGPMDNAATKDAVMKYGGVYAGYVANGRYYAENVTYFYRPTNSGVYGDEDDGGHAVMIVGWDDDFPREKFRVTTPEGEEVMPEGPGAFICKNSYGLGRGEQGYLYVSYYSGAFMSDYIHANTNTYSQDGIAVAQVYRPGETGYNTIYQYDPLGPVTGVVYEGYDYIYGANVFPEKGKSLARDETLKAVSFYTYYENTDYEVYVVTDYEDSSSLREPGEVYASGSIRNIGYHTVELDNDVSLKAGTRFAVVVKLSTPGREGYFYCEYPSAGRGTSKARAGKDESYVCRNPSGSWFDLYYFGGSDESTGGSNYNVCIKAFTDNGLAGQSVSLFEAIDNEGRAYDSDKIWIDDGDGVDLSREQNLRYIHASEYVAEDYAYADDFELLSLENGGSDPSLMEGETFPSRYDLRDKRIATPVRNQGGWGACWAHATCALIENSLVMKDIDYAKNTKNPGDTTVEYGSGSDIPVAGIALSRDTLTLGVGSTWSLAATVYPLNAADRKVSWYSSDPHVAFVDADGRITARSAGKTDIIAVTADGKFTERCSLTVLSDGSVYSVKISGGALNAAVGDEFALSCSFTPANAANKEVAVSVSDPRILSVDENGRLTALAPGSAEVTVTTLDGGQSDTATVYVHDTVTGAVEVSAIESGLAMWNGTATGSVAVRLSNRFDNSVEVVIYMPLYSGDRQLSAVKSAAITLEPGTNTHVFNDFKISDASAGGSELSCFVWQRDNLRPLCGVFSALCGYDTEYEGEYQDGVSHGRGRLTWANGDVYEGDFLYGAITGKGKFTYANGNVYEGDFADGLKHGQGIFTWASGDVYEGDWVYGAMTGRGRLSWTNGDVYEGDFVNGLRHGRGKYVWQSGSIYEGDYVNGQRTGKGMFIWPNGDVYEGDFADGKKHGQGRLEYVNGNIYEGDFADDKRSGQGRLTYADGSIYEGDFVDGLRHGYGRLIWTNGDVYEGDFAGGTIHGHGKFIWPSGAVYDGSWADGRRHGTGIYTDADGTRYEQVWENGALISQTEIEEE